MGFHGLRIHCPALLLYLQAYMTMFSEKLLGTGELFIGRIYCQRIAVVYCAAARLSGSFRVVRMAI